MRGLSVALILTEREPVHIVADRLGYSQGGYPPPFKPLTCMNAKIDTPRGYMCVLVRVLENRCSHHLCRPDIEPVQSILLR